MIEAADQEDGVDVGGQDLLVGVVAGRFSREQAAAGQDGVDRGGTVAGGKIGDDPVADGGEIGAGLGVVA